MTSSTSSSRDTRILLVGLFAIFAIGGWWFYRNIYTQTSNSTDSPSAIVHHDFSSASTEELKKALFSGSEDVDRGKVRVLDARPGSLWSEEHVIGSENLSPEDAEHSFEPHSDDISAHWIILGDTRDRAQMLADAIADHGIPIDHIRLFDGTFSTWKAETGLITAPGDPSSPEDVSKVKLLQPADASTALQNGSLRKIVDVRSSQDFSLGHIPKAINIPFPDLEYRRNELSPSFGLFAYGGSDIESFRAGTLLFDLGIFPVTALAGSFDDWKNAGLPVEK